MRESSCKTNRMVHPNCKKIPRNFISEVLCRNEGNAVSASRCSLISLCNQIMDERWESEVIEYGAINITGFRLIDISRRPVKDFLENWRRLDTATFPGAGRDSISVCILHHSCSITFFLYPPAVTLTFYIDSHSIHELVDEYRHRRH